MALAGGRKSFVRWWLHVLGLGSLQSLSVSSCECFCKIGSLLGVTNESDYAVLLVQQQEPRSDPNLENNPMHATRTASSKSFRNVPVQK